MRREGNDRKPHTQQNKEHAKASSLETSETGENEERFDNDEERVVFIFTEPQN